MQINLASVHLLFKQVLNMQIHLLSVHVLFNQRYLIQPSRAYINQFIRRLFSHIHRTHLDQILSSSLVLPTHVWVISMIYYHAIFVYVLSSPQVAPLYPDTHAHEYVRPEGWHVPPFWQGLLSTQGTAIIWGEIKIGQHV